MTEIQAANTQLILQNSRGVIFTVGGLEVCLLLPLSVFYLYLAYRGLIYYRANSFNMTLLISNGLGMLLYSVSQLVLLVTDQHLIDAKTNLISAYHNRMLAFKFCWWFALFYALVYWITHWTFAFKYWTLARKFEKIQSGQDPNSINRQSLIVLVVGIIFNCLGVLLLELTNLQNANISHYRKQRIASAALIFTIPLYVSWLVLADAFRRFKNSKQSQQVISNMKVLFMVITYFFYAFGASLVTAIELIHSTQEQTQTEEVNTLFVGYGILYVAAWSSELVLAIVLQKLMVAEWRQNQPQVEDFDQRQSYESGPVSFLSGSLKTKSRPVSIESSNNQSESSLESVVSLQNSVYSDSDMAILATVF